MKIYTKTGDAGQTQVYVDKAIRVSKHDPLIECYGAIDELNAHVGLLRAQLQESWSQQSSEHGVSLAWLTRIQNNLFSAGFAMSASSRLPESAVAELEEQIDDMQQTLAPQTQFILPGGSVQASQAHVCRTVCRRAERQLVSASEQTDIAAPVLQYVNRLSDWLFVFARYLNLLAAVPDTPVSTR